MSIEELIPINNTSSVIVPPKPPAFNSIPSLLSTFQNEWDSLALEVFSLRKQLHKAREELSASLYHHDAAVRVAAKAIKERDEAKLSLQQLAVSIGKDEPMEETDVEITTNGETSSTSMIPAEIINRARDELFQLHKSQKPTLPFTPEQNMSIKFVLNHAQPFKKSNNSFLNTSEKLLLVGSSTGPVAIYDFNNPGKNNITKISHKGTATALNQVTLNDELVPIMAFKDKVFVGDNKTAFKHNHNEEVFQIITHPTLSNLFILISKDETWSLNNIENNSTLFRSQRIQGATYGNIHVDGALLGIGTKNHEVIIHNLTTGEAVSKINSKNKNVTKVLFAPNGYWLLVSSTDDTNSSCIEIIDLRKNITIHSIEYSDELVDFTIDPSSSIIVSYDSSNTLRLHRFIKKGKKWLDNAIKEIIEESNSPLRNLDILSSADDEEFANGNIKLVGVTQSSSILEFNVTHC